MMGWRVVAVIVLGGCGRLGFDHADTSGVAADAAIDAAPVFCMGVQCPAADSCGSWACGTSGLCEEAPFAAGTTCGATSVCTGTNIACPTWQQETTGSVTSLRGLRGSSPDDVFAVGDAGTILHLVGG